MEARLAAAAGAVAHGVASRLVQPRVGLVASDLLPGIQRALAGEGWDPPL
jgi:NAD(P)H-hydrate repair Nnr-like enzyme with NAD(P)H-hydrate dehydratase domain